VNQVSSAGIMRVRTPSAVALIHITFATFPTRASLASRVRRSGDNLGRTKKERVGA
jgi:hypothetical protein